MRRHAAYQVRTVLVGGIALLGDPFGLPKPRKNQRKPCPNPTQPANIMQNPSQPGRPAKPATARKATPKDEDYSTPYKPPAPAAPVAPTDVFMAEVQIDDNIPLPPGRGASKLALSLAVISKLQRVGQSARLPIQIKSSLQKALQNVHKTTDGGRYQVRLAFDDEQSLRVWRVS